jgi:hypothetical protein
MFGAFPSLHLYVVFTAMCLDTGTSCYFDGVAMDDEFNGYFESGGHGYEKL